MRATVAATTAAALATLAIGCGHPSHVAIAPLPPTTPPPAPIAPAKIVDQGAFTITLHDAPIGKETFTIKQGDGFLLESTTTLEIPDLFEMKMVSSITTDAAFRPLAADVSGDLNHEDFREVLTAGPPLTVDFTRGADHATQPATHDVDFFFADNAIVHMAPLCREPPDAHSRWVFPGSELKLAAAVPVPEGAPVDGFVRRDADLAGGLALHLYCHGDQLVMVEVPMQDFRAVRDGMEQQVAALATKPRAKPALPVGLVELDRTVAVPAAKGIEAASLSCSLLVPAAQATVTTRPKTGALPAVVFITGSGPEDRDEDSYGDGGLKLAVFKTIAIELGKANIASMRCDDRGSGKSTGTFASATLETFAADAAATVAALRAEPAIDPARVGLVGHSEGGTIAPVVASHDAKLRAIVLMAGTGRSLDVVILEQLERGMTAAGTDPKERDTELATTKAAFAAIKAGKPLPDAVPAEQRAEWEKSRAWLASHFNHDPVATARTLHKVAVMIAQGDKDQQVSVVDAQLLRDALTAAKNPRVDYRIYANLNHLFAPSTTGDVSEYADPNLQVDASFIADVVGFLQQRL